MTRELLTDYAALVMWSAFFGAAIYAALSGAFGFLVEFVPRGIAALRRRKEARS